ncbi:hypothetical protein GGQ92_002747 [Gracilibacillus halotolerans]|uniref:DUF2953 domain-containing protein n=1 Tax=Gracilibacillus halotolerans TaxID=74386 RepID=A0A841RTU4_9BACI|nr:hypothetical protein [Gracilibacillus halotolerans]MBB6513928.1 hypothetical protein [Gracilibacillus halotolerans]
MIFWIIGILLLIIVIIIIFIAFSTVYMTINLHIDDESAYFNVRASVYFFTIYKKTIQLDELSLPKSEGKRKEELRPLLKRLRQEIQLEWIEGDIVVGTDDVVLNAMIYPFLTTIKEWLNQEKNWQLNVAADFAGNDWYVKGSCMISIKLVKTIKAWKLRKEYV